MSTLRIFHIALVTCSIFIAVSAQNTNVKYASKLDTGVHEFDLPSERATLLKGNFDSVGRSIIATTLALLGLPLILLALALIFVPIPVIAAGRGIQTSQNRALELVEKVVSSEECLERLSCELSSFARTFEATSWIPKSIGSFMKTNRWMDKLTRGMNPKKSCRQFACNPVGILNKL